MNRRAGRASQYSFAGVEAAIQAKVGNTCRSFAVDLTKAPGKVNAYLDRPLTYRPFAALNSLLGTCRLCITQPLRGTD